jgi:hypothetical protein
MTVYDYSQRLCTAEVRGANRNIVNAALAEAVNWSRAQGLLRLTAPLG